MKSVCIALALLCMMSMGCMSDHKVFVADTDPAGWTAGTTYAVWYTNADTVSLFDLAVLVRYRDNISVDAMTLNIRTTSPDSITVSEPLTFHIAGMADGGSLRSKEIAIPYRERVRLSVEGDYLFEFTAHKNQQTIKGICGVGVIFTPAR